jgi:hypothetical protein
VYVLNMPFHSSVAFLCCITDQPLRETGYTVWDYSEPNNAGGNEDCLCVKKTGGLNDVGCDLKLAFVCEREL